MISYISTEERVPTDGQERLSIFESSARGGQLVRSITLTQPQNSSRLKRGASETQARKLNTEVLRNLYAFMSSFVLRLQPFTVNSVQR